MAGYIGSISGATGIPIGYIGSSKLGSLDVADLGSGSATDGYVLAADGAGGTAWEEVSGGGGEISDAVIKTALNASGSAPVYACRAWVTFRGTSTVVIHASGNVSSVSDLGTGNYRANFSTALPDANYAFAFGAGTGNGRVPFLFNGTFNAADTSGGKTTSSIRVYYAVPAGGSAGDHNPVSISVFR